MNTNTRSLRTKAASGQVLIMTLFAVGVVGLALVAQLSMLKSQNTFTQRSQMWQGCMPIVEAGIEEAMAHLNNPVTTNLAADGWSASGTTYTKQRFLGDGYYNVSIYASNMTAPVIISAGYIRAPVNTNYIARTVRVTTFRDPLFIKAMVARTSVDMKGNNVTVDSYRSSVGMYVAATARDKGDVSTDGDWSDTLSVGNANIKGKIMVGPKANVKIGPNGSVGSTAWHLAGKKGIESGWLRTDMNVRYPDVEPPWTGGAFTPGGNGGWKYVLDDGNYELSSLTLNSGEKMHVMGKAVLWVKGNVSVADVIKLSPGATLKLFVSGNTVSLNDAVYDKSDIPSDFILYGLPTCKNIDVKGFAAVIYAPQAQIKLNGNSTFYGATITDSIVFTGNTAYHYDESLAEVDDTRAYIVTSWTEL